MAGPIAGLGKIGGGIASMIQARNAAKRQYDTRMYQAQREKGRELDNQTLDRFALMRESAGIAGRATATYAGSGIDPNMSGLVVAAAIEQDYLQADYEAVRTSKLRIEQIDNQLMAAKLERDRLMDSALNQGLQGVFSGVSDLADLAAHQVGGG